MRPRYTIPVLVVATLAQVPSLRAQEVATGMHWPN